MSVKRIMTGRRKPGQGLPSLRLNNAPAVFALGEGRPWLDRLTAEGLIAREHLLLEGAQAAPGKGALP